MKLFSRIYGENNQEMIIIHGLFGMSDNWSTLGKRFSEYYKVHLIDLRNHGRSPHSKVFNYQSMCEDLLEYIYSHNIKNPILLGHSLGGKVAIKFAFTYSEKIEKLIVVDIAPRQYNTDFHEGLLQKLSGLDLKSFSKRKQLEDALSLFVDDIGVRLFLLKNLYRKENDEFVWRFNIPVLLDKVKNIQDDSFVVGTCKIPTFFIKGGDSDYIQIEDERKIYKHFINCSIATLDGAGHWVHAEQPERFYNEVIRFCLM